ncbi:hypothetical protein HK405_000666, partial [Cladochytrium tenue]
MGILQVGEIEALLQSFPEGRLSLSRLALEAGAGGPAHHAAADGGPKDPWGTAGAQFDDAAGGTWENVDLAASVAVKQSATDRGYAAERSAALCCSV